MGTFFGIRYRVGHRRTQRLEPLRPYRGETDLLTDACPTSEAIAADIARDGVASYSNALDADVCRSIRAFWLDYFEDPKPDCEFVRGNLVLGEPNFLSYSDNATGKLYRYFDFLWNDPIHAPTRELAIDIHRLRNRAQGFSVDEGLGYDPSCYGIYVSVSYYVPKGGWFHTHSDGHQDTPILHHMVPLTFSGRDFESGGLFAIDRAGNRVDLESSAGEGTLLFFDGRQEHGVDPIESSADRSLGRLAIFAIPTFFDKDGTNAVKRRNRKNRKRVVRERLRGFGRSASSR